MKKYINSALLYALVGMLSGVFYREFTKINDYTGGTKLSLMHGHYLILGLFFFLILLLLDKQWGFSEKGSDKIAFWLYHVGLNITGLGFLVRGVMEVTSVSMSKGLNASIAGVSGIGHMLLAVGMVMLLIKVRKKVIQ